MSLVISDAAPLDCNSWRDVTVIMRVNGFLYRLDMPSDGIILCSIVKSVLKKNLLYKNGTLIEW